MALRAGSRARKGARGTSVGVAVGVGVSLVFWGLVGVVVGVVDVGR